MKKRLINWLRQSFRTKPLSGHDVGWFIPAVAIVIGLTLPTILAFLIVFAGGPVISGPSKDGTGYDLADHIAIITGALMMSFLASWLATPFALLALRAAAMLGYAGWGTALLAALILGLPVVHVFLNRDLTTDRYAILPQVSVAIALLGLSVWVVFWGLIALRRKKIQSK